MLALLVYIMKGLRENIIDFEILRTGNPKTMVFVDSSDYIGEPDRPLLEVIFPGYNKFFLVNVVARQVNTFNSNTLGFTDLLNSDCLVDLPDGVYRLKYKICPYTVNYKVKNIFRSVLLEDKLKYIYDKLEASACSIKEDKKILSDIAEIHMLLEGCHYIVESNQKKATEFYALASNITHNTIKKLDKTCR